MAIRGGIFKIQQVYGKQINKTWPTRAPGISPPISNVSSVNEGSSVTVNVNTFDYEGQTLYWTLQGVSGTVNSSDLTPLSGSFVVGSNNFGTFTITTTADTTTEGVETFRILIRTDSTSGPIKATSPTITINDTSVLNQFSVEYIVVAGGAGGGGLSAGYMQPSPGVFLPEGIASGGGGAGGYTSGNLNITAKIAYTVSVGAGGSGGSQGNNGSSGGTSQFSTISRTSGGGGGRNDVGFPSGPGAPNFAFPGLSGAPQGAGGGGAGGQGTVPGYAIDNGASGGGGVRSGGYGGINTGGGGGGIGGNGFNGVNNSNGGSGGPGVSSPITGTSVSYAGGGGGGAFAPNTAAGGPGNSGGGAGGRNANGSNGTSNSGSGGGGAGGGAPTYTGRSGGSGGSGVVIVAYPNVYPEATVSPSLTFTRPSRTNFHVYRFTGGSGTITFN